MRTEDLLQLRAVVSGRVQRVGYRSYSAEGANRLGLVGWVVNRPDGAVETVAEGTETALKEYEMGVLPLEVKRGRMINEARRPRELEQ